MLLIGLFIVAIIAWFSIDYYLGRKDHLAKSKYEVTPLRQSDFELIVDGNHLFKDLFHTIQKSKESIHILFYIVRNDQISHDFLSLLAEKASQGVDVKLLVDHIGSYRLKKKTISKLKTKGVKFSYTHKVRLPFIFYTSQARNHRKISVIDGKTAYLGGFNVGKEYLGHKLKFGLWRDYHLKITGEGVTDLQRQFLKDWFDSTGENYLDKTAYFPEQYQGSSTHHYIATYGIHLKKHVIDFIQSAEQEIFICTPYFIPGKELLNELLLALKRGVRVRLMVPMKSDHPFVKEASFPYYGKLIPAGCEVYRFYQGFYHAKVIIIDDRLCDIGTANFDKRSQYLNDEMNCVIYDSVFINELKKYVDEDLTHCELLTYDDYKKRPFHKRITEGIATLISHFL
ncbi:cardiolipin synthase [Metabacillus malikii]|uniref:cardiolipin synthase n=1 Tax=Metabacillus malikii TaxID=1504265 RepID=UPI0035224F03